MTKIGTDEWVDQVETRTEHYKGLTAPIRRAWDRVPIGARFVAVLLVASLLPAITDSGFVIRVGINALLFALLALGLNVVVGNAGLLDLGYVAFYGFGAYCYALLSSDHLGINWPTELVIPIAVVASAMLGYLLGLPSRRLLGDYLAIVTLFFGQMFVQLAIQLDRIAVPWSDTPVNLTGGPNGIVNIAPMQLFGFEFRSLDSYFYLLLALFALVATGLWRLNRSRTGRAWRALREDPLAAEALGIPANRLKLAAFAVGGATAGLAGTVFAAVQVGVFPQNFEVILLIMVYAAVILGGTGSIPGVVIGGVVIAVFPEILRSPEYARLIFYGVLIAGLFAVLRPWWRLGAILGGTLALGFALRGIATLVWPDAVAGRPPGTGLLAGAIDNWVLLPPDASTLGNYGFVVLIAGVIALSRLRGLPQLVAFPPVLYLATFVWENRLVAEPSVTRQLILGAILVVMMNARPQGLLGKPRVEIV